MAWLDIPVVNDMDFNRECILPQNVTIDDVKSTLLDLYRIINIVNTSLVSAIDIRLEELLRPNSFPDFLSVVIIRSFGEYSRTWTYNRRHDGFPDLVISGSYPGDQTHHGEGIEIKATKFGNTPQGHNPEKCWLMIFYYLVDRETEPREKRLPTKIVTIMAAELIEEDWSFSSGDTSRRTKTASINAKGLKKLRNNVIYQAE